MIRVHRLMFELANGPIPEGKVVMHICNNILCVNPDHLRAGTQAENMLQCSQEGRIARRRGENAPRATISSETAKLIKETYRQGNKTQRQVAQMFNVSRSLVSHIVAGNSWKET